VSPGQLFFVGDPRQSIYRFRRADIAMFLAAKKRFGDDAGGLVELTANFRSTVLVIEWVNAVFGRLIASSAGTAPPVESQPNYVGLQAVRPAPPSGAPVCVLGRCEHESGTSADGLRGAEAAEVAATISRIMAEGWDVGDKDLSGWRPARLGDITVLVPARTSLPFLEDALDATGIAYRAESSSLVYATRAVRDLLMVLRAVGDPTNTLHVVSALRTPLLGCGDDDLFRFKVEGHGHWNYLADQPAGLAEDDPVRLALGYLRALHDERYWLGPSELLDRIARDRRALELGFAEGRPRDVWRRLRFVADQARAWHEATGGNLRQYLAWVESQAAEGARVEEVVLPETDDDAVRIMTIHAAKGLEFPITIVSGLSTRPQHNLSRAQVVFPAGGGVGYRVGRGLATSEFEAWIPIDEQMAFDERIRLLYVACTRARDHLVVSLHRAARRSDATPGNETNAELLLTGVGDLLDTLPDGPSETGVVTVPAPLRPAAPPPFDEWTAERAAALVRASRPTTVAATALSDEGEPDTGEEVREGLEKRPRDLDLPPWLRGRYGSAVGRAVHGVLQVIDLGHGSGIAAAVAAQCEAEAIVERAGDVRGLVEAALDSSSVVEAARSAHWRELYVCVPLGERLLEGYVDLLYRRDGAGLVVVDYKTASTADPDELERRVEGYRRQGAAYALAVAEATAEEVEAVVFVFLTPAGAIERHLPDLEAAVADVRHLIEAGAEVVLA
jgi:ATP-dependent helicase/nuclease subunit A